MNLLKLMEAAKENGGFLVKAALIVALIYLIAFFSEKIIDKKSPLKTPVSGVKKTTLIGMFSAISVILMLFEIPVGFAPPFYKIDFSEIPILICAFALGPVAGVMAEFIKIILNLVTDGTTTVFVGEFANFIIGCSYIVPAAIIYRIHKTKKMAGIGVIVGTICMTIFGSSFNAFYLLPTFAKLYGMHLDDLVAMGNVVNSSINSVSTLVLFAVVPLNILKGGIVSIITVLIYKKISIIFK